MKNDTISRVNPTTGKERRIHTRIGESVGVLFYLISNISRMNQQVSFFYICSINESVQNILKQILFLASEKILKKGRSWGLCFHLGMIENTKICPELQERVVAYYMHIDIETSNQKLKRETKQNELKYFCILIIFQANQIG